MYVRALCGINSHMIEKKSRQKGYLKTVHIGVWRNLDAAALARRHDSSSMLFSSIC